MIWYCAALSGLSPHETVADEYGAMAQWWLTGENQRNGEKKYCSAPVYNASRMKPANTKPEAPIELQAFNHTAMAQVVNYG
jgi:hypothetical protein